MIPCRVALMIICLLLNVLISRAQTFDEWFHQKSTQRKYLIQQITKLQLYLEYVKKGYDIVKKGLTTIGEIKNDDFSLHSLFFNNQYITKSSIKNYSKTREIVTTVAVIKNKADNAKHLLSSSQLFTDNEKQFIHEQLDNMLTQLLKDITMLNDVLRDNTLQMNDIERIERIDKIEASVAVKKGWVIRVSYHCNLLMAHRIKSLNDLDILQKLNKP